MIKIPEILIKIHKCREIELFCEKASFCYKIASIKDLIDQTKNLISSSACLELTADVYRYREILRAKITQHLEEIRILEQKKLLIEKEIKSNFLESKKCKSLKEGALQKSEKLKSELLLKKENEYLNAKCSLNVVKKLI
jgi:hypothetical protein